MHICMLYYEDCPSHELALKRLQQVLQEAGIRVPVEVVRVETEEQAQQWRFPGSPTIRINGHDIVPTDRHTSYGLTCRAYQLEDGRISPLPSSDMLRTALHAVQTDESEN